MKKIRLNLRKEVATTISLAATGMKKVLFSVFILFLLSGNLLGQELISRGKPAVASRTDRNYPTINITDGNTETFWNAGGYAPQWVQIDLQNNYNISSIRLNPEITPSGRTVQKISVSEDLKVWKEIDNFTENNTASGRVISRNYNNLLNIRGIKVETTLSPSYVAWREIEVFGTLTNGVANNYTNSNSNSLNVYETIKKIDCYTKINPEVFTFPDKHLAFVKMSENTFSLVSTQDLEEKNIFNFKGKGNINLGNSYIDGNYILLAVKSDKGEIKEYIKYNLSNFSFENVKCKNAPRGCIMSSASSNYILLRNNTAYDFEDFKIFFKSNGYQYFYEISKIVVEKTDFNIAIKGNRNEKLDFLKKYPNSEHKNDIIISFTNSFTSIKDISDFSNTNKEFNTQLDERAFILVQNTNSEYDLQEYLSIFPNGKYVNNVNNKIASIKQAEEQEKERQRKLALEREQKATGASWKSDPYLW